MAFEELKRYPSGFLGSSSVLQTEPMSIIGRARNLIAGDAAPRHENTHTSNQEVVEMWASHLAISHSRASWEYHEALIGTAVRAFGTESFADWVISQKNSPDYSENHSAWIDETLAFIFLGHPRQFSFNTWSSLLGPDGLRKYDNANSDIVTTCFFGKSIKASFIPPLSNGNMIDVIHAWLCVPGGAEDLRTSLSVLFGKQ